MPKKIINLIKSYQAYRLRKFCAKQICKSRISRAYGVDVDYNTGSNLPLPLANEAQKMYQFIKDGSVSERLQ